jgi:predicted glycoside hydrolase/deacetylase ChbG (UPF0249 family)
MVRYPAAAAAAAYARDSELGLGLHVDLGEWMYDDGAWQAVYEVEQTSDEVRRQLATFRRLARADPTHLDSHQHVHRDEPARSILGELAEELRIPLRHMAREIAYCGDFYGQTTEGAPLPANVSPGALASLLTRLPDGVTELCCHPAAAVDFVTVYGEPRLRELETLCDPALPAILASEGIELRSFRNTA